MATVAKPKWTIGTVNWDSFDFIKYQLKYFHEFNEDFEFIIHDNENTNETLETQEIKTKYPSTKLLHPTWQGTGGGAHGIGLNECLKRANGKYFLAIDPDFFFMNKNILSFLESYFV